MVFGLEVLQDVLVSLLPEQLRGSFPFSLFCPPLFPDPFLIVVLARPVPQRHRTRPRIPDRRPSDPQTLIALFLQDEFFPQKDIARLSFPSKVTRPRLQEFQGFGDLFSSLKWRPFFNYHQIHSLFSLSAQFEMRLPHLSSRIIPSATSSGR